MCLFQSKFRREVNEIKSLLHAYRTRPLVQAEYDRLVELFGLQKYNVEISKV